MDETESAGHEKLCGCLPNSVTDGMGSEDQTCESPPCERGKMDNGDSIDVELSRQTIRLLVRLLKPLKNNSCTMMKIL